MELIIIIEKGLSGWMNGYKKVLKEVDNEWQ